MKSVIPYMAFENGVLAHLEFMPAKMGATNKTTSALPSHAPDAGIIKRFADMSEPYDTKIVDTGDSAQLCAECF